MEPLDKHLLIGEEAQMPRAFFIAVTLASKDTHSKVLMLLILDFLSMEALIIA